MTPATNATVDEWLSYLEAIHPSEIDMGLARISAVAESLACLKPAPLVILVAGTNGKGTTSALLSALLQAQGLSVGLYNSPHIHRYNERVSVNGTLISDDDLCRSFAAVEAQRGNTSLTYFEFGTLAALWHFTQQPLDAVVLEIGLGGRLDAVNIVDADISIVTSIGLDHQAWLGDTVEAIAYEKCSIARAGKILVCGQINPPDNARPTVEAMGARWVCAGDDFTAELHDKRLVINYQQADGSLGKVVVNDFSIPYPNIATAVQTLALLDRLPDIKRIENIISTLRVPGRMQQFVRGGLTLTLDVAHNPQAAAYLASRLHTVQQLVLGMLSDKDVSGVLAAMPLAEDVVVCGLDCQRGLTADKLAKQLEDAGYCVSRKYNTVADALNALPESGHCLVAGSFYTVAAASKWLSKQGDTWNSI